MPKSINIRVSVDLHAKIFRMAAADSRSVASWCALALAKTANGNQVSAQENPIPEATPFVRAPPGSLLKKR